MKIIVYYTLARHARMQLARRFFTCSCKDYQMSPILSFELPNWAKPTQPDL
jgi:hypothetical protein